MELRKRIENFIGAFIVEYSKSKKLHTAFGSPVIGFADAASEYFKNIKSITNEKHAVPQDILPNAGLVIAYYIPFTKELAKGNDDAAACTDSETGFEHCSGAWARAYGELNALMSELNTTLAEFVMSQGYDAAVPSNATVFDKELLMSYWSQRHIAYAAGLGTFGMNNMLISRKGCCGRYNSIVTAIPTSVIKADEPMRKEMCLFKKNGSCGVCMRRCPVQALSPLRENVFPNFERKRCYGSCMKNEGKYPGADVCGKCVTGAACAFLSGSEA